MHDFVTCFTLQLNLQEAADVNVETKNEVHLQPVVIARGAIRDTFIVTEGHLLFTRSIIPTSININMQYPHGCSNFYSFLE